HLQGGEAEPERTGLRGMIEALLQQLADRITGSAKGETARQLYLDINISGLKDENDEGKAAAFDAHKDDILPVLIKDCSEGCDDLQRGALEMLGHLAGMAEWISPFQPHQAAALWSAVARVLHDEAQGKISKIAALFAISNQTMGPNLMETSAALLAPAVATSTLHASTVVRRQAALATLGLLRDAPLAMATCATGSRGATEENDFWAPCLLRLCLDDCVGVRVEALKAAKLAAGCLKGHAGVAEWVLGTLKDGSLFRGMDRVMFHQEGSKRGAAPTALSTRTPPLTEHNVSQPSTAGCATATTTAAATTTTTTTTATPSPKTAKEARVKHAIKAWAIFLSLADLTSLLQTRGTSKNTFELATNKLLQVASGFSDKRAQVRAEAVEAWEMFVSNCLGKFKREEASKYKCVVQRILGMMRAPRDPFVKGVVLSSLARCVASFPSQSVKYLWRLPQKHQQEGRIGMADLLRKAAGDGSGEDSRHFCARMLAALLPCLHPSPADAHPCLQQSGLDLVAEVSPLLATLQTLMRAIPAPSPEVAAARVGTAATLPGSEPNTPSAPLDALPTSGLIVRAWCGLTLWALSEHRQAISSSGGGGGGGGGTDGAGDDGGGGDVGGCSTQGGGRKGHGKLGVAVQGKAPPLARKRKGAIEGSPLTVVLSWLLLKEETPKCGFQGDVATREGVDVGASRGNVVGGGVKGAAATTASSANSAEWRSALLAALIRALTRLSLSTGRGGGPHADLQGTERIRGCLEAPMLAISPPPASNSASPICPECARAEDVEGIILSLVARASPLWVTLLAGVLRERCDCHRSDATGPSSARRRGDRDVGEDNRPSFARQTHGPVSPLNHRLEGAGGRRRICFPRASLLTELLTLAPKEGEAWVLSSLSTAIAALPETKPTPFTSALLALGRVWHAEAARSLSAWKIAGLSRPAGDGSVDGALDSPQRARGGLKRPVASHNPVDITDAQPSDRLLGDTADTLQFLLKTASLVARSPPSTWEPLSCAEGSAEGVGGAVSGRARGTERFVVGGVGSVLEVGVEGRLSEDEAGGRACSQGSFSAVDATFGAEAADLWQKLFDARQGHRPGFSSLLRKIAKDCAALALSAPREALVGPALREDGARFGSQVPSALDGKSTGWTLEFSQTQQRGRRGVDSGNDRRPGASGNERQLDAAHNVKQGGLKEQHLALPPPFACLPVLTTAALALLRSAPKEPDNKSRGSVWRAGLVTLAWILTSSFPAGPTPLPASAASPPSAGKKGGGYSTETPRTAAAVIADGVITEVRECLIAAGEAVTSGPRDRRPPRAEFPLDEASMAAMSRLLAVGVGRSGHDAQRVASANRARRASSAQASCVAAIPFVSDETRGLASIVVSTVKNFSPDDLVSPGLLPALSPMLEAALEIPMSRPADALQSAVIDMWNNTFGVLPAHECETIIPRRLRRHLSDMAKHVDVKIPFGIALEDESGLDLPKLSQVAREQEAVLAAAKRVEEHLPHAALGGARRAVGYALPGSGNDVAGALPAASAKRSFMRQRPSSPPSCNTATTPKKRSPSTPREAPTAGGSKFVRVIGGARGGASGGRTKRAPVTTYTSLDGSQAPWDDGSQLPDSELDSEPALLEEDLFPESGMPVPQLASKSTPPDGGGNSSLGKRGREGTAADTAGAHPPADSMAVNNPAPSDNAGVSEKDSSDRRVRPHVGAAVGTVDDTDRERPSETSQERDAGGAARGMTEDDRMAATMAAIAKESSASVGEGGQRGSHSPDSDVEEGREDLQGALNGREGGVGVDSVVQDVMRLARSLKAARPSMSSEQLEEVDLLLRQSLK
ncbi:unnamed protein product, partial [Laminaria digitata]